MGNLRTLAHAFRNFPTAQIPVSFTVRKVQKVEGKRWSSLFVVVFQFAFSSFCYVSVFIQYRTLPFYMFAKAVMGKECVLLLPKQTIIAALVTCGHPQLGRWTAGTQPSLVFCREQTFRLVFLSCSKHVQHTCAVLGTRKFKLICLSCQDNEYKILCLQVISCFFIWLNYPYL